MRDLSGLIKAYDVRGLVPEQLDATIAHAIGVAAAAVLTPDNGSGSRRAVVVGHDMRESAADLVPAFVSGLTSSGVDVVEIGLASTDQLYFASGWLDLPGAMFTASHNPAAYNGIKLCRPGAVPVGQDTGLAEIRRRAEADERGTAITPGEVTRRDVLDAYAAHLKSLVDIRAGRPLRVVVDAGNGMAGHTAPAVLDGLGLQIDPLYFELDGSFPNHEANPIDPANLVDLVARVRETGADIGLAFDGDADRCFVVDERGEPVSPSVVTALIAERELAKSPGATVIHNLITSRVVPETVLAHGGVPVRTRVGHSFIKQVMAETGAVFGGEHSGHFYFRDFWRADSGMLAALHVLAALGETAQGATLSQLLAPYSTYVASGEINSEVDDVVAAAATVRAAYEDGDEPVEFDDLDGMTVSTKDWWFNVRPSNTEPLLRLNVEATDEPTMARVRDDVLALIRREPAPREPADA